MSNQELEKLNIEFVEEGMKVDFNFNNPTSVLLTVRTVIEIAEKSLDLNKDDIIDILYSED